MRDLFRRRPEILSGSVSIRRPPAIFPRRRCARSVVDPFLVAVSAPGQLPEDIVERVRALCLALPEVTVRVDYSLTRARSTIRSTSAGGRSACSWRRSTRPAIPYRCSCWVPTQTTVRRCCPFATRFRPASRPREASGILCGRSWRAGGRLRRRRRRGCSLVGRSAVRGGGPWPIDRSRRAGLTESGRAG